jgi:hypothetical protein
MALPAYLPTKKTQEAILAFGRQSNMLLNQQWAIRSQLETIDRAYIREVDRTAEQYKARNANRYAGDPTKFQNVIVPVVMPQVEQAVTYQQSVFLTGYPIFGVVACPGFEDEALMMDSIMGEHQIHYGWIPELLQVMRDGFKYNLGICEATWDREITYALEVDTATANGAKQTQVAYAGNKLRRIDPYNAFWDTRCKPEEVAKWGEFFGYNEIMSRIRMKQFVQSLPSQINVKEAFESGFTAPIAYGNSDSTGYYMPFLNPEATVDLRVISTTDWMAWAGIAGQTNGINYGNMYQVTTIYARILPSDFGMVGIPAQNTPQVWKFIIVNNQVVIFAERMTNVHNLLPMFIYQPVKAGLDYQDKSFAQNIMPFQEIVSALTNSNIAARRRAISDRVLYDPSRISAAAINNDSPTAKIPVRPSAYQDDLSKAVYPFPFRDDQFQVTTAEVQGFLQLANNVSGLNPARQGQFVKGNKTRFEYADVMNNANGRDQTVALSTEGTFFTPLKEVLKTNILQYQGGVSLFNQDAAKQVRIDPVALRKAVLAFKVSDGLLPSEKLIDGDALALGFQTLASNPQLSAGYNTTQMFSYLMSTRGAKLKAFEKSPEQIAYEQALASWQQAIQTAGAQIAQALQKVQDPAVAQQIIEQIQKNLPPQPTPDQYGYVPGKSALTAEYTPNQPSILESMGAKIGEARQQAQGQQGAAAAGVVQGTGSQSYAS